MKKIILILAIFLPGCLHAAMTLNDCLVYARDHAHRNRINAIDVRKGEADVRIAMSGFLPAVDLSTSGNLSFGRNIDPETNTYDDKKTFSAGLGVYFSLPLFDGLVNVNTYKVARVARLRKEKAAQVEQDVISFEVIRAFYNVSYCKAMVAQVLEQLERDSTDLLAVRRGLDLGIKSGADVAELEALVATDEYELANQRNLLAKAYLALRTAMGMEPDGGPLDLCEEEEPSSSQREDMMSIPA